MVESLVGVHRDEPNLDQELKGGGLFQSPWRRQEIFLPRSALNILTIGWRLGCDRVLNEMGNDVVACRQMVAVDSGSFLRSCSNRFHYSCMTPVHPLVKQSVGEFQERQGMEKSCCLGLENGPIPSFLSHLK